jgi:Zn-dependent protease/CBS domain-containing protein
MKGNALRLGRILGIEIRLDYSWFIIFVLVTWSLAAQLFPDLYPGWSRTAYWVIGVLTALLFFGSVLAHELAHSVVSQRYGVPVTDITLFIFGGASHISDEPKTARGELAMALVGPGTSLVLSGLFGVLWFISRGTGSYLYAISGWLAGINLSLAVFNLIPGFPLDGGRVFRAIVWAISGNLRLATRIATGLGRLVAFGFILAGVGQIFAGNLANGLWIAFIGWFLENASANTYRRLAVNDMLAGHTASEVMSRECTHIPADMTVATLVNDVLLPTGRRCFPVEEGGHVQGLVTVHRIQQLPRQQWPQTRVDQVMIPRAELKTVRPDDALSDVLERMAGEDVNQLVVIEGDQLLGLVARDRLLNYIQTRSELGV